MLIHYLLKLYLQTLSNIVISTLQSSLDKPMSLSYKTLFLLKHCFLQIEIVRYFYLGRHFAVNMSEHSTRALFSRFLQIPRHFYLRRHFAVNVYGQLDALCKLILKDQKYASCATFLASSFKKKAPSSNSTAFFHLFKLCCLPFFFKKKSYDIFKQYCIF